MPPVVAAIAAAAEVVGGYWALTELVVMVASVAYTAYSMANLPSAPGYTSDVQGRTQVIRSAVAPHRVVYGKCMVSGPLVGAFSSGTNNENLSLVIALAAHECAAIEEVWLGDRLSTDAIFTTNSTNDNYTIGTRTHTIILPNTIDVVHSLYYVTNTGPLGSQVNTLVDPSHYSTSDKTITLDSTFDADIAALPIWGALTFAVSYSWSTDHVAISKHLGASGQTADAFLLANAKDSSGNLIYSSDHKLSGRCYIVVTLKYSSFVFAQGIPNIKALVKGVNNIYDPRTNAAGWTDNSVLCVRDLLKKPFGNINCDDTDIDDTNFVAKANVCDETVYIQVGTGTGYTTDTAGYEVGRSLIKFITGSGTILAGDIITITIPHCWVRTSGGLSIVYSNPHDSSYSEYLASALSYVIEVALTSTGWITIAGGGLIAAVPPVACAIALDETNSEKRYTSNGSFTVEATPLSIVKKMLTACAGRLVWSQGKYSIFPAVYDNPVPRPLTESDLRDSISILPQPSRRQGFNTVRGTFVSPAQYWQQVDFPYVKDAAGVTANGELSQTLELPYTTSSATAQRLATIFLKQNLFGTVVTFPGKLSCFFYKPGDVVCLNIAELGWVDKEFRVTDWKLSTEGGVDMILREEDYTIYGWTSASEGTITPPPITVVPTSDTIAPITNLSISAYDVPVSSGSVTRSNVTLIWAAGDGLAISFVIQKDGVDYAEITTNTFTFTNMIPATYTFGVIALNSAGVRSTVVESVFVVSVSSLVAPPLSTISLIDEGDSGHKTLYLLNNEIRIRDL